ncbi:MAG: alpha-ribazole phosphatase [Candidatus Promineifilaceae bacterium]
MKLILVRHGETDWNMERRYQGQLDVPLNERGRWQAGRAAQVLAGQPVDYLISSDLRRALDTAEAIGSVCGRKVTADSRLRELSYGKWEGLTVTKIKERYDGAYRRWRTDPANHPPEGGEVLAAAARRVEQVWQEIKQVEAETVVLVSHGGTLRILLRHLLALPPEAFWQFKIENASLSTVQISAAGNILVRMNDTGHLLPHAIR